jgi:hypothetical protein
MATPKRRRTPPPPKIDLRTEEPPPPPFDPGKKRFDIFLIDSGWNRAVSEVVHSHLPLMAEFQKHDSLYVLTPRQSIEVLKHDPALIGHDPMIIFYDVYSATRNDAGGYHGFRLCLGLMKHAGQALARLQECIRFIAHNRACETLDTEIRRELHREGVHGIIKVLRDTTSELLVE